MNIAELGLWNIEEYGEYVSLIYEGREYTNVELDRQSACLANALRGLGMKPWDRLGMIQTPTLVLHGRYDAPPLEMGQALAEAFPTGTFEVLSTGHFPYLEDREGLLSAVSGFFAGLR